jgi:hypothetical protein
MSAAVQQLCLQEIYGLVVPVSLAQIGSAFALLNGFILKV